MSEKKNFFFIVHQISRMTWNVEKLNKIFFGLFGLYGLCSIITTKIFYCISRRIRPFGTTFKIRIFPGFFPDFPRIFSRIFLRKGFQKAGVLCKKASFDTRMSNTVWKFSFSVEIRFFWPSFGLRFYTTLPLASLGTAWYKIYGLIPAKKMNFIPRKKIFIPSCTWSVEKRHWWRLNFVKSVR